MEELKLLIESIAGLPDLAIWVVGMYFFFKLAVVGSIFGVARLFIQKLYESIRLKYGEKEIIEKVIEKEVIQVKNLDFGKHIINGVEARVADEVKRIIMATRRVDGFQYIHDSDVNELIKFTDAYVEFKKTGKIKFEEE